MAGLIKTRTSHESSSASTCPAIVKKYSCMYTTDLLKQRKVWHDGFIRIRHFNSKVYLISEEGQTLAESFLRASLMNRKNVEYGIGNGNENEKISEDLLCYMKVPPVFELEEDQEIEFDPTEDSESRPSSYMARIVSLVKIETENVPLMTPLNSKAKQELHKRKMEILDKTILQLSKRPKTQIKNVSPIPSSSSSSPFKGGSISPSRTPIISSSSSSRRKLTIGFETRPFNSPLLNAKSNKTLNQTNLDPFPTPTPTKPIQRVHPSDLDTSHSKLNKSTVSIISKPTIEPFHASSRTPPHPTSSAKVNHPPSPSTDAKLTNPSSRKHLPNPLPSRARPLPPPPPPLDTPPTDLDRISKKKTLKINWDSYFQPTTKPSS